MKIIAAKIDNLYSYENAELRLKDYNVLVGHNASGKTNILRIFDLLGGLSEETPLRYPLDDMRLPLQSRLDPDHPTSLSINIILSEMEARLLMEAILHRDIDKITNADLQEISVVISWSVTVEDASRPDFVFVRFGNGLSLIQTGAREVNLCHIDKHTGSVNDLRSTIRGLTDVKSVASDYQKAFGFVPPSIFNHTEFQNQFLSGGTISQFFKLGNNNLLLTSNIPPIEHHALPGAPSHVAEIVKYSNPSLPTSWSVSIWLLIRTFLNHDLSILRDIPVDYDELAQRLFALEKSGKDDTRFEAISTGFSRLFKDVKFKILQPDLKEARYKVRIIEPKHTSYLEDTASGYYEALRIFSESVFTEGNIVILDEPALHLHPTKIKLLARILSDIANNQVIVITHSPFFVDTYLFSRGRSLIYVKKTSSGKSEIYTSGDNFDLQIKSHLFEPEIFFSRFNIFVEGPGDLSALTAISDYFNSIFETNDIVVVHVHGYGYVDNYYKLVSKYQLPSIFMVDKEYSGKAKGVIKLDKKLEYELRKMGWKRSVSSSADPSVVYDFVFDMMQKNKTKVKKTRLARVFNTAIETMGTDSKKLWKK